MFNSLSIHRSLEKLEFWNPKNLKSKKSEFEIFQLQSSLRSAFQDLDSETDQRSFVRTSFTIWKIIFYLKSWIPYLLCNVRQKRKGAQGLIVRKQSKDIQIITRRPRDFYWIKFQSSKSPLLDPNITSKRHSNCWILRSGGSWLMKP